MYPNPRHSLWGHQAESQHTVALYTRGSVLFVGTEYLWHPQQINLVSFGIFCESLELLAENLASFRDRGRILFLTFVGNAVPLGAIGQLSVVTKLLDSGDDIDGTGGAEGGTPLYYAAQRNHIDVTKLLIDRGANVNAVDHNSRAGYESQLCPLRPRTTPFPEEKSILEVIYGVALWADMNATTPLGAWGRSVISFGDLHCCRACECTPVASV